MAVTIKFCGAAGMVTGSCYWVSTDSCQFLVDCGMFQGSKTVKELNYGAFPFDPAHIDFVFLTHAHTDHAGLLPKLVKQGFRGNIYTTAGTRDLLAYMLPDSAYIQDIEVARLNYRNRQRGRPTVEPIYSLSDAEKCLSQIRTAEYENWVEVDGCRARFWNAGHILGSASVELELADGEPDKKPMRLLFSGDVGPDHKAFHPDPTAPQSLDFLFCESTYGDRQRSDSAPAARRAALAREINDALKAGGALVIPAFAVERTQELLLDLSHLLARGDIPRVPVFVDSPLAIKVTSVFAKHAGALEDTGALEAPFAHSSFHFTETPDESRAIARFSSGVIILAASGMCDAGRIRHHLKNHLWQAKSTILLVGYQAEGTLGRLLEQRKKRVKIQGDEIQVRACVRTLDCYSGHADKDSLLEWLRERRPVSGAVFLTHGGQGALAALREAAIADGLPDSDVIVPQLDEEYELCTMNSKVRHKKAAQRIDPNLVDQPDWHNELAQLTLDLQMRLNTATNDKDRAVLLRQLDQVLKQK